FSLPEMLESGELLTINNGGTFALVETPYEIIPPNLDRLFWMLQVKGITPILAHPERNVRLLRDPMLLHKWVEAGTLVQVTAGSIEGSFGGDIREFARDLLRRRMVHFVASDAHNAGRRCPALSEAREITASIIGPEEAKRIFTLHPSSIVRGELPEVDAPLPPETKKPSLMERFFPFW
ncbi:MAG: CpsB/CapC family capsule biosynthesis tyrosine phosphatase, partial [Syntrophobacter sp.]